MLRNTLDSWGLPARTLHWLIAAIVLVQVPLGFWMVEVYDEYSQTFADDTLLMQTSNAHHTLGFMVLIIAAFRLAWRFSNPTPDLPASLLTYQRYLARSTQALLYFALFVYPLSGWAVLSAYDGEFPIFFFGYEDVPRIVPQVAEGEAFDSDFFVRIHGNFWHGAGLLLGLHIISALRHQYVARDGLLRRMWRGRA
jgi:cytochrome b561